MNGLLYEKINKNSDLYNKNKEFLSSMEHFSKWNHISFEDIKKYIKFEVINIEKDNFYFIIDDNNKILINSLISSHEMAQKNSELKSQDIKNSLCLIKKLNENYYNIISNFVTNIWNVKIKKEYLNLESQLTSCTFPSMPFSIFLSNKALFHIPPKNIFDENSLALLAENIYHEAVHSAINYQILYDDIFIDEYDSKKSEKILIPWRQNQIEERNKAWEIDRVYHATIVYRNVIDFRKSILYTDFISEKEKEFIQDSIPSAIKSYNFLLKELNNKKKYFTKNGLKSLSELIHEID